MEAGQRTSRHHSPVTTSGRHTETDDRRRTRVTGLGSVERQSVATRHTAKEWYGHGSWMVIFKKSRGVFTSFTLQCTVGAVTHYDQAPMPDR